MPPASLHTCSEEQQDGEMMLLKGEEHSSSVVLTLSFFLLVAHLLVLGLCFLSTVLLVTWSWP